MSVFVVAPRLAQLARAEEPVYVVNSLGDGSIYSDHPLSDPDLCATPANECTLRAAIDRANANLDVHERIHFDIDESIHGTGPHQITMSEALPILIDPAGVTIDGYTQDGAARNTLDHGTNATLQIELVGPGYGIPDPNDPGDTIPGPDAIFIRSSDNVITGLAIHGFGRHIRIYGDDPLTPDDDIAHDVAYNRIVGNFIGTDAAGSVGASDRVIGGDGVHIQHGAFANRIGMPGNEHRNVISGVADRGVGLYDPDTDFNLIQNNIIGLAPGAAGDVALPNRNHGIDVNYGASRNTIGGWSAAEANVISGNSVTGVEISHSRTDHDTERNLVAGNLVGTNTAGTAASNSTANGQYGIYFEGKALCTASCDPDIRLNVAAGNVVVGSRSGVVISKGAHENTVVGNWIGVLRDGSDPYAGTPPTTLQQGVSIEMGAFDNRIEGNTIANSQRGIHATAKDPQCPPAGTTDGDACRAAEFPVYGNTFSMNSITDTSLQGIELRRRGATSFNYTEGPGTSGEVNGGIDAPVIITSGTDASDADRVVVTACAGCVVEVFETPTPTGAWADFGRGERFMLSGVADAGGRAEFVLRGADGDPMVILPGSEIAATATDTNGNTSEFGRREAVPAGSFAPPTPPTTTIPSTTTTTVAISTTTTPTTPTVPPTTTTTTTVPPTTTTVAPTTTTTTTTTLPPGPRIGGGGTAADRAIRCGQTPSGC
ncbi:MAG: NosD domain-containing protein [Actinomycetota bacterium]